MADALDDVVGYLKTLSVREADDFADRVGVPRPTVMKLKYDQVKNPRWNTIRRLRKMMEALAASPDPVRAKLDKFMKGKKRASSA